MMGGIQLFPHQSEALIKMKNGCILNGGVGSGKSITSLAYYYIQYGGRVNVNTYIPMINPPDLYIITTARKRDTLEWEDELIRFKLTTDPKTNYYKNKIVVDSWNNIQKYKNVKNAFFIFDEQRVVGKGAWVKAFLVITKYNKWILLSATPGDTWSDYIPVFLANGFYRNKTEFNETHVVFSPYVNYPQILKYVNEARLIRYRQSILVNMDFQRKTVPHHEQILCNYDSYNYKYIEDNRWNIFSNKPIETASEYCQCLRRLINSDISRQEAVLNIIKEHPKAIIFYSYDYELEILRNLFKGVYLCSEWNGHLHEKILTGDKWVYLVQYTAGNEGWNCITCDTIIFYSQSYSYKVMKQACGRIDRLNTPFTDLYYYHLKSAASIDKRINQALNRKKKFNEKGFAPDFTGGKTNVQN